MSLRLFVAPTAVPALLEFDDAGVSTDRGVAFSTRVDGHPVDVAVGGDAKLRRIVQWIRLSSDAVIAVTPVSDEQTASDQRYVLSLALADGTVQRLEVPCSVRGRRFGALVEVLSGAATAIGEAALSVLPKRSQTGGDR